MPIGALRRSQLGASLLFALITLVALALAATALVRSVDTGAIVLGNLGSKRATSAATDRVTQAAVSWLSGRGGDGALKSDLPNEGYYANAKPGFDFTGFQGTDAGRKLINWDLDGACGYATAGGVCDASTRPSNPVSVDSNIEGRFLITRLCTTSGYHITEAPNSCASPPKVGQAENTTRGELQYAQPRTGKRDPVPFYRIVVRVVGPRNAVTYSETIVNL
jgi:type IV pilus assembly protein PilX